MRKVTIAILLFSSALSFQFCSSSKKATTAPMHVAVTYQDNIMPVIQASCTPCHIAGKGNKKSLDNYANASSTANDMIARIQKNPGDHGFMPMRKPKLSDSTINIFVEWAKDGLKEK